MGFRLRSLAESLPPSIDSGEFIRKILIRAARRRSVPWEQVAKHITECREDEGIPMFRTRYLGPLDGHVLMVCYGGIGRKPGVWFKGVPPEDIRLMESKGGEWLDLLDKYGTPEQKKRAFRAGVRLW